MSSKRYSKAFDNTGREMSHAGLIGTMLQKGDITSSDIAYESALCAKGLGTPQQVEDFRPFNALSSANIEPDTIFCDIDGCIFKHDKGLFSNTGAFSERPELLISNIGWLRKKSASGTCIVFVTSRPDSERNSLLRSFEHLNIPHNHLITGISSGPRLLINDYKGSFRQETALAFSTERDVDGSFESFSNEARRLFCLRDVSKGSGAKTYLLSDFNNDYRVRKMASACSSEATTLNEQCQYLQELKEKAVAVPYVIEYCFRSTGSCWYDMNFVSGQLFSTLPNRDRLRFLPHVVAKISDLYHSSIISDTYDLSGRLERLWADKVDPVFNDAARIKGKYSFTSSVERLLVSLTLENRSDNFNEYVCSLSDSHNFVSCLIHGDLTYENILFDIKSDVLTFIDPLGGLMDPYSRRKFSYTTSPFFDIGKLFQSELCNYEDWSNHNSDQVSAELLGLDLMSHVGQILMRMRELSEALAPFSYFLGPSYLELGMLSCSIVMARVARYKIAQNCPSFALCLYYSILMRRALMQT